MCGKIVNIVTREINEDKLDDTNQVTVNFFVYLSTFFLHGTCFFGTYYTVCVPHRSPLLIGCLIFWGLSKEDLKDELHKHWSCKIPCLHISFVSNNWPCNTHCVTQLNCNGSTYWTALNFTDKTLLLNFLAFHLFSSHALKSGSKLWTAKLVYCVLQIQSRMFVKISYKV